MLPLFPQKTWPTSFGPCWSPFFFPSIFFFSFRPPICNFNPLIPRHPALTSPKLFCRNRGDGFPLPSCQKMKRFPSLKCRPRLIFLFSNLHDTFFPLSALNGFITYSPLHRFFFSQGLPFAIPRLLLLSVIRLSFQIEMVAFPPPKDVDCDLLLFFPRLESPGRLSLPAVGSPRKEALSRSLKCCFQIGFLLPLPWS